MKLEKIGDISLIIIFGYVVVLHILKIVYLHFKPKFLNPVRFGPPSKMLMTIYYIFIIYSLVVYILRLAGVLEVNFRIK